MTAAGSSPALLVRLLAFSSPDFFSLQQPVQLAQLPSYLLHAQDDSNQPKRKKEPQPTRADPNSC